MHAILIDDELSNIENLSILLQKFCPDIKVTGSATNIADAIRLISQQKPELLFLDIQLSGESGFDLLKKIPEKNFEVIFVTAFDQYGIQAIKFAALDYLLKPVDIDELITAVNKAATKIRGNQYGQQLDFLLNHLKKDDSQPVKIALPQQKEIRYVPVCTVIRCEAANTYTFFYLTSGEKILVSRGLKEYADLLQSNGFLRTHQSHLVNTAVVKSWIKEDGGVLLLNDGSKIPVSKPNRERVMEALKAKLIG